MVLSELGRVGVFDDGITCCWPREANGKRHGGAVAGIVIADG